MAIKSRNRNAASSFTWLAFISGKAMLKKSLSHQTLALSLFLLSGCELTQNAQRDFNRLINGNPSSASRPTAGSGQAYAPSRTTSTARPDSKPADPSKPDE